MTAPHPALALQKAIQSTVAGDAVLTALIGARVFDRVPDRARTPYVVHGEVETLPLDGDTAQHLITLEVWSRARGRREVLEVMAGLRRALHGATPTLERHRLVSLREITASTAPGTNGLQRGTATYRAVTEPNA